MFTVVLYILSRSDQVLTILSTLPSSMHYNTQNQSQFVPTHQRS